MANAKGGDKTAETEDMAFEEAMKRLENIVEAMEAQELPLETLLARYEEGARLAALLQKKLKEAESKVQQLEKDSKGEWSAKPLGGTEEAP
jgi:exodeoxyribonuclease VII small subunit